MPQNFFDFLTARVRAADSLLCVGLDPRASSPDDLRSQCYRLIEATAEAAAAFKPNSAFFEAFGPEGIRALGDVIAAVPEGIPVILDAKRGDIADTAEAYARAAFDVLGAHALTVNSYLGGDALAPFLARPERGAFVLCKTSNPGAGEFQALPVQGGDAGEVRPLFGYVARAAQGWNANGNVGLVVGATDPEGLARVRDLAPDLWFLVPGVGAQGGDLASALAAGLRADGLGLLITVSRSVARAAEPAAEAARMRDEIRKLRPSTTKASVRRLSAAARGRDTLGATAGGEHLLRTELAADLVVSGCVRFGQFTLKSGAVSPIYLDLRRLVSHPGILRRVARAYAVLIRDRRLAFDRLAGIPYAALPIATALSLEIDRPLIYPRREVKEYGTRAALEGDFNPGESALVIDDLATTGSTKGETIQKLESAGLKVRDIVVLIDREQGAGEALAQAGYRLHAVALLSDLMREWQRSGAVTPEQAEEVRAYLRK